MMYMHGSRRSEIQKNSKRHEPNFRMSEFPKTGRVTATDPANSETRKENREFGVWNTQHSNIPLSRDHNKTQQSSFRMSRDFTSVTVAGSVAVTEATRRNPEIGKKSSKLGCPAVASRCLPLSPVVSIIPALSHDLSRRVRRYTERADLQRSHTVDLAPVSVGVTRREISTHGGSAQLLQK